MKRILINMADPSIMRAAVVVDGKLDELLIEQSSAPAYRGCIYLGKVINYERSLRAAFVDIGRHRHGFLPLDEISPALLGDQKEPKKGQEFLVQVTREENMQKGAMLTTHISMAGRYVVYMPEEGHNGVSRKIGKDEERKRLKEIQEAIVKKNSSVIMRTSCEGCSKTKLAADYAFLRRLWTKTEKLIKASKGKAPQVIYEEQDFVTKILREYMDGDLEEILIDEEKSYQRGVEYLNCIQPRSAGKILKFYQEKDPLLYHYQIESQISEIFQARVNLPSGGSLVIEQTEALVSIDVNSGKTHEANHNNTALRSNLEAAKEIVRQLRLRDLGGIIVIDFIDMESGAHERQVMDALKEALKSDRARVKVGPFSQNGTVELNRQRRNSAISTSLKELCPCCGGSGHVLAAAMQASAVLQKIRSVLANREGFTDCSLLLDTPQVTALSLLNERRLEICQLEEEFGCSISIRPTESLFSDNLDGINIKISKK